METPAPLAPVSTAPIRHIAFIADGNRRWANKQGVSAREGFAAGALAVHRVLAHCRAYGLEAATVFLMSERNFDREGAEVDALIDIIIDLLDQAAEDADGPVGIIGHLHRAPGQLLAAVMRTEAATRKRTGMAVNLAIGYDGRADIIDAVTSAVANGGCAEIAPWLSTSDQPDPDLIVRTSGERRLSGFLLWQAADATLHFDDRMWPDYTAAALAEAIGVHYEQRRTFGR